MNSGDIGNIVAGIVGIALYAGFFGILIGANVYGNAKEKSYMEEQRQTGRDKQRMLYFMQIVMKEYYNDYIYAVGNNKLAASRYARYYYPYIVCFNEKDIVVISYAVRNGALICRNILPIDWSCMQLKYHIRDKGVKLVFQLGKTKMRIYVNFIVTSDGSEKFDTPLGIVQEQEVFQLIKYLPHYK